MFDQITTTIMDHFNDPEVYGKAQGLLKRYNDIPNGDWNTVETYLMKFNDEEYELLNHSLEMVGDARFTRDTLQEENTRLKKQVEDLKANGLTVDTLKEFLSEPGTFKSPDIQIFTEENDRLLSDVIDEFLNFKIDSGLAPGSLKPYKSNLNKFKDILKAVNEDAPVKLSHITVDKMRIYADVMWKYPKNYQNQAKFKGEKQSLKSVVEYVKSKTGKELEAEGVEISSNQSENFRTVRQLIKWAKKRHYPFVTDIENIIEVDGKGIESKTGKNKDGKANRPYGGSELKKLFENDTYRVHAKKFSGYIDYWGPLIAIHTGATLSEICQLHFEDIRKVDGIDVIDINANGWKKLKNDDGRPRLIPIHPNLIKLGLLDFVGDRKNIYYGKTDRIFPEAKRDQYDKYDSSGKRFATFRKQCGVTGSERTQTFHSFRSTVASFLRENGCPERIANDIIGHTPIKTSETYGTYSKGKKTGVPLTYEWVKKIGFGIDFNYPKNWRAIRFRGNSTKNLLK
ncbi:site-specific integrase [Microbulbifer sp.]|uniref:site-specific integrase n=1 Tax=Microbulbifer sp. TaxID=1908541 RepID=UPI00258A4EF2|nr:site-specific integrase [Microbulbifer sp.]